MVEWFTLDSEEAHTLYLNSWPLLCESLFSFDLRESVTIHPQTRPKPKILKPQPQTPTAN